MKNICLCIYNLANRGGEERMCCLLANELHNRGFKVIVVSLCRFFYQKNIFSLNPGIRQYSIRHNRIERKLFRYGMLNKIPLYRYRKILAKEAIDVIIDVDIHQTLVSAEASEGLNIKIVSWDHFCHRRFRNWDIYNDIMSCYKSGAVDKLVVLTNADRKSHIDKENLPQSFVCHISNPSPIQQNHYIRHDTKRVLAVGRLQTDKGYDMLLETWAKVEAQDSEWSLEIVGDGPMREELLSLCNELRLERVEICNFTSSIEEKYKSASIFVLSSRDEGFGLVLVEAMAMSLPLVSFACEAGPKEIIKDGYNGLLIEPGNTEMLATGLLHLIKDPDLRERMSHNAFESSKLYGIKTFTDKWVCLLNSL